MPPLKPDGEEEDLRDRPSQLSRTSTDTTKSGVTDTTSQVTSIDSRTTLLRSMVPTTSPGDQMVSPTQTLRATQSTTGTTRVTVTSATDAVVTDAVSAMDMDIDTLVPPGDTTATTSRTDSVLVTTTHTSVTSQDPLITSTDTVSVDATPRDGPTDTDQDSDSATERDTEDPTDGLLTTDMEPATHPARDQSWVMVLVLTLLFRRDHAKCEESS